MCQIMEWNSSRLIHCVRTSVMQGMIEAEYKWNVVEIHAGRPKKKSYDW